MGDEPREWTRDEVAERFLDQCREIAAYWSGDAPDRSRAATGGEPASVRDRVEGAVHSMLALLDGCSMGLPAFVVAPRPHADDREFMRGEGENWFPVSGDVACDISGSLHEGFFA